MEGYTLIKNRDIMKRVILILLLSVSTFAYSQRNAAYFRAGVRLGTQVEPQVPREGQIWWDGDNMFVWEAGTAQWIQMTGDGASGSPSLLNTQASICVTTAPMQSVSFTKADNADWLLPENQDIIIPNALSITRANNRGIFNIVLETEFDRDNRTSPLNTRWALGKSTDDISTLSFGTFTDANGGESIGNNIVGRTFVVEHNDGTNPVQYFEVTVNSWTSSGSGGGFSYTRTELYTAQEQLSFEEFETFVVLSFDPSTQNEVVSERIFYRDNQIIPEPSNWTFCDHLSGISVGNGLTIDNEVIELGGTIPDGEGVTISLEPNTDPRNPNSFVIEGDNSAFSMRDNAVSISGNTIGLSSITSGSFNVRTRFSLSKLSSSFSFRPHLQVIENGSVELWSQEGASLRLQSVGGGDIIFYNETPSVPGQVWTATGTIGQGYWADAPTGGGGGGGAFAVVDEGNGNGIVVAGRDPLNHGSVGLNSIDFTISNSPDFSPGAVGNNSFAWGDRVFATGNFSMALGNAFTRAAGDGSFAIGNGSANGGTSGVIRGGSAQAFESLAMLSGVTNPTGVRSLAMNGGNTNGVESVAMGRGLNTWSYRETVIGSSNTNRSGNNSSWVLSDPLVVVGNGQNSSNRSDAFTIYKNGATQLHPVSKLTITSPQVGMLIIDSDENNKLKFYDGTAWQEVSFIAD